MNALGFQELKVVALAVEDTARATRFYQTTLGLAPASEGGGSLGFMLGDVILMLKPVSEGWYAQPSTELNPRLTFATTDARETEKALLARGVTISDPVQAYPEDGACVGAFLDSEGNRLWFCSALASP